MFKSLFFTVVVLSSSLVFSKSNSENSTAIKAKISQYIGGWEKQSGELFARPFSKDSNFVNIFTMKLNGKKAIADRHQVIFDGFLKGTKFEAENIYIREVANSGAIAQVNWKLKNLVCKQGKPCPKKGVFTHTFVKNKDGVWQIESTQNTMSPPSIP